MKYILTLTKLTCVIFSVTLLSCQDRGFQEVKFETVDSVAFPILPGQFPAPRNMTVIQEGQSRVMTVYDHLAKELVCYDFDTREIIHQIPIRPFGNARDDLWRLHVHNLDSIFCLFNAAKHPRYWHDSTLLLLGRQGEIKNAYDLSEVPVWTSSNPDIGRDSVYYLVGRGFTYFDNRISLPLARYGVEMGDSLFSSPPTHPLGYLDISEGQDHFSLDSMISPSTTGAYFPSIYSWIFTAQLREHEQAYSYIFHPRLTITKAGQSRYQVSVPSVAFDSVPPQIKEKSNDNSRLSKTYGSYLGIKHHRESNTFWRFVSYPFGNMENMGLNASNRYGFIITDTTFNILGEGVVPKGHLGMRYYLPEGIALWNQEKSMLKQDSMYFTVFSYHFEESSIEDFRQKAIVQGEKRKPGGWTAYMNDTYQMNQGDFVVLFVPAGMGCEGCLDYMLDFFRDQVNSVNRRPIYAIVAGDSRTVIAEKLESNYLSLPSPNLFVDTDGAFKSYVGNEFFQGRVLLFSDGKLSGEIIVDPAQLSSIPSVIQDFFDADE